MIEIISSLFIPEEELTFEQNRGGGPGGQKVNKTSSKITLVFDVTNSPSLTDYQRHRFLTKLANRLSKEGVLRIDVQSERSLTANRRLAIERFASLLKEALKIEKVRKKSRPTLGAKKRRLKDKKKRGDVKRDRGRKDWGD
ncbi:MAG: ribosome-associated protein [Planctomycetota bacterium]|jgi:ribosome-associated protein